MISPNDGIILAKMNSPIVILTDFGTTDPFVGIMKGVLAKIAPKHPIIDLTHEIPPGDIQRGAIILWQSLPYFPEGSVFLAVVDPGVGTHRRPILLQTGGHIFIGPDNGLFSLILDDSHQAWELQNPRLTLPNPGMTFHGRDIFAPSAGYAARGIPGPEFGESVPDLKRIPLPQLDSPTLRAIHGQVLHADRFGNLLTSLGAFTPSEGDQFRFSPWVGNLPKSEIVLPNSVVELPGGPRIPFAQTFGEILYGEHRSNFHLSQSRRAKHLPHPLSPRYWRH